MLYDEILSEYLDELNRRQLTAPDLQTEIKKCHELSNRTLNKMRRVVVTQGFEDQEQEIRFFKEIKIKPLGYLIYYAEVCAFLANRPQNHKELYFKYIAKQIDRVDGFLTKHVEFLIYMESKDTHFDPYYFTREYMRNNMAMHRYPYMKDEEFDTDKDYLLAKLQGWGMYVSYLKKKKWYMESLDQGSTAPKDEGKLKFTGKPIEKSELYYSLLAAGVFNNGKARMIDIIRGFGHVMGDDEQEVYRRLGELKKRKDPAVFLRHLIVKLERFLEDGDAIV